MSEAPMEYRELTEAEKRVRRRRSVVLAFVLAGLAVMFFFSTIVRLGGNVGERML
jgi:hypothetical protein